MEANWERIGGSPSSSRYKRERESQNGLNAIKDLCINELVAKHIL